MQPKFNMGDRVRKTRGSEWQGRVVGTYSTTLTPEGYAVESEAHSGSVQIYPASALEAVTGREEEMLLVSKDLIRRARHAINWHLEPNSPDEHEETMRALTELIGDGQTKHLGGE